MRLAPCWLLVVVDLVSIEESFREDVFACKEVGRDLALDVPQTHVEIVQHLTCSALFFVVFITPVLLRCRALLVQPHCRMPRPLALPLFEPAQTARCVFFLTCLIALVILQSVLLHHMHVVPSRNSRCGAR